MEFKADHLYHVYNRGNKQKPIFYEKENYHFFLRKMRRHLKLHANILAYCLMPNHFHWLLFVNDQSSERDEVHTLNDKIGSLLSSYTKAMNKRYGQTGSLFQQQTKASQIESQNYGLVCFHYIHQNPLKASLVDKMGEWPFSSYPDYAEGRNGTLPAKDLALDILDIRGQVISAISKDAIDPEKIERLYS